MEFRVLGPLEVRVEDSDLLLGAPAERQLLAVLLVFANQGVSTGRLIDELWGDDPPATARNLVQGYVSRLRKLLHDPIGERLVTETRGYRLVVEDDEVDAARFERLVAEARDAPDADAAAAQLCEALGLWRGRFLEGLDAAPAVAAERVRLEEARLAALEDRIERDLGRGLHRDLVSELKGLTEEYPHRERMRAQLMLALYRSDRQPEALRAFTEYRDRLGAEMGLEPGPDISQLEERVLLDDPDLALPAGGERELPAGDVTFLFTDIEGSTALWEQHPAEMPAALARHDELLHQAVSAHGGVVFKNTGDGICAAFGSAQAAVRAALDAQHHLAATQGDTALFRVRMALHTGVAEIRGGDYLGPPLNRTARLLATAHGGQIVTSQVTEHLVRDQLPQDASHTDLGEHHLKDLSQPERIFQLLHPSLRAEFPPLRSLGSFQHNLPHRLTEFIGRHREIETVADMMGDHRLVTLIGAGGVGKTSLALRVAAEKIERFPGGAWLVELVATPDSDLVAGAVGGVLGIEELPGEDVAQALSRYLAGTETLLILDNCEHVIDGAAKLTAALLEAGGDVRVLATSREPLAIAGEATHLVPSLELPSAGDLPRADLVATEAVALFMDRARGVSPGFDADDADAPVIAEICRKLDGIPLAIELAVARLNTMTPRQIAARLDDRFQLLTKGRRAAPARHQTLEALIDWSHDALAEPERVLLRRLVAFAGNFTLEAAEQVCSYDPLDRYLVADLLDRLTSTSMLIPPPAAAPRYRMLETIRQYARLRLDAADEREVTMRRLATYLLDGGPGTSDGLPTGDAAAWFEWRHDEQDNFRAALSWAIATEDGDLAARILIEIWNWFDFAGFGAEVETWLAQVLPLMGERTHRRLRLTTIAAYTAITKGDPALGRRLVEQLRWDADVMDEQGEAALARWLAAHLAYKEGNLAEFLDLNADAVRRFEDAEDQRVMNPLISHLAVLVVMGRYDDADRLADSLEERNRRLRDPQDPTLIRNTASLWKAYVALYRGDYATVERLLEPLLPYARRIGAAMHGAFMLVLGLAALFSSDHRTARARAEEVCAAVAESGNLEELLRAEQLLALVELETGSPHAAAAHLATALAYAERHRGIVELSDILASIADTALATADYAEAAALHAAAATTRERLPTTLGAWHAGRYALALKTMRTELKADFAHIWAEGSALSPDNAIERAHTFIQDLLDNPEGVAERIRM